METSNQNKVLNQPELLAYIIESINRLHANTAKNTAPCRLLLKFSSMGS